jgi:chromosome segregation ATPase
MKKWYFVIAPILMLGVFLVFYFLSTAETERREQVHLAALAAQKADADQKKKIAEETAREDAEKRNEQRLADEAKTAQEKQDKYEAAMRKIQEGTDKANATAEKFAKQVSDLSIELDALYKQKDEESREAFELAKKVQAAQVARRNAELDIQRMVEMIADRSEQSAMAKMRPRPPRRTADRRAPASGLFRDIALA